MEPEFHAYRLALRRPYRWAHGVQHVREGGLVHGGGWGEVALPPHEPFDAVWAAAAVQAAWRDPSDAHPRIRCGVTTAQWSDGENMAQRLAAHTGRSVRGKVAVNALVTGATPDEVAEAGRAAWQRGFTTLKLKVGDEGPERVAALRAAVPGATLRLDANGVLSDAVAQVAAWAPYDIEYIEQPVPPADETTLRALHKGEVRIALDEAAVDAAEITRRLDDGQGSVVILKPQRLGGPLGTLDAMAAVEDAGATCVITNSLESSVGVHAALHLASLLRADVACGLATSDYLAEDVAPPPSIEQGRMTLPSGAGLGVEPQP